MSRLLGLFMRWQEVEPIYVACLKDIACRSSNPERLHCVECLECININNRMRELTNAHIWEPSGIGADAPEPSDYLRLDTAALAAWRRAWRLHCALIKAAMRPRRRKATS